MDFPWQRIASALAIFVASIPALAHAEPIVRIRAESRIELGVTHTEQETLVEGALRDELAAPLPGRPLVIEASVADTDAEPLRVRIDTDLDGHFALELPRAEHDYRLVAKFEGDDTHRGVRVERRVERARADVRLELRIAGGPEIDLDRSPVMFQLMAESDAGGDQIALRLLDANGHELGRGHTDPQGRLTLPIASDALGEPGPSVIRVESLRDERRAEAQTEARILRRRHVQLALWSEAGEVEAGEAIQVGGRVATRAGPRAYTPVGLFIDGRHIETVVTDEQGRFRAALWRDTAPRLLEIRARTEADRAGAYPQAETRTQVKVIAPRPLPLVWMLGALIGVIGPLLLWVRSRSENNDEVPEPLGPRIRTSIHPARAHGRRDRHRIHGCALDALTEAPIAFAKVRIEHERSEGCATLAADAQGRFASEVLPSGAVRLIISSAGYAASESELTIPHRGEWSSFVIRLLSLRERALSPLRRIANPRLPSGAAWGIWTTRETRDYLTRRHGQHGAALAELTAEVERACYSRQGPSEEDVRSIDATAAALENGLSTESSTENTRLR